MRLRVGEEKLCCSTQNLKNPQILSTPLVSTHYHRGYALLCVGFPTSDIEVETQDEDEVYWLQFGRTRTYWLTEGRKSITQPFSSLRLQTFAVDHVFIWVTFFGNT
ncbi:hypothetical protein L1987_46333 [Smallanthus sonchifolius]|uniref:Uncharacterized protein n=1 Tax=Smallanthus sonchifolius TaxID=185202 RepID=A0ACB9G170_9ASTR|nr:hypothetical protein L1987_46333 [Smallanthus sonchifolius]